MTRYQVTGAYVNIHSGIIALSPKQYEPRQHNLEKAGDGMYTILSPIQFKRGEQFGYDGEINKALLQDVEPLETTEEEVAAGEDEGGSDDEGDGDSQTDQQPPEGETTTPPVTSPHNTGRRNRGR